MNNDQNKGQNIRNDDADNRNQQSGQRPGSGQQNQSDNNKRQQGGGQNDRQQGGQHR